MITWYAAGLASLQVTLVILTRRGFSLRPWYQQIPVWVLIVWLPIHLVRVKRDLRSR